MLIRRGLFYLSLTAWLIVDVKVEAYKSGCSGGYCFVISDISDDNERTQQSTAQKRCQSNGTELVEIRNKDIENSLANFIRSQFTTGWNVLTNGKRSSDNWIRLNIKNIGSITVYEQTYVSYAYGYLKLTPSGFDLFASRPADNKGGFICTGLSDCSGGVTINGQCYRSFLETLSWYDARNKCLEEGGDLASFDHITTNDGFNALNGSWLSTSNSYWIGIRREWWTWQSSNSDVKYSAWINGHPVNDVGRTDINCLCLAATDWKWTECDCNQQTPFVCFLGNSTTSNTPPPSTKTTTTSTTTTSSTFTSGSTISGNSGVPSLTTPPAETSKSTPDANHTETPEQQNGLSRDSAVGIGVGVGVGGALIIIALVAAAIILCRRRCPLRCPQRKPTTVKLQPPDILMQESINADRGCHGIENPYAQVVSSLPEGDKVNTDTFENTGQPPTVYAQLGFCSET